LEGFSKRPVSNSEQVFEGRGVKVELMKSNNTIRTAVILAAGAGRRLMPLTANAPKCLTEVNGIPILGHLLDSLVSFNFEKVVLVVGHFEDQIRDFVQNTPSWAKLRFEFVTNPIYRTTNNIYSLWIARNKVSEDFLLLESDIVFDSFLLEPLLSPDRIAIATFKPSMQGSSVKLDSEGIVSEFYEGEVAGADPQFYKTVNIYSLSKVSWKIILDVLEQRILAGKVNKYYETVFSELVSADRLRLEGVKFDHGRWFEIDSISDLKVAENLFASESSINLRRGFDLVATGANR